MIRKTLAAVTAALMTFTAFTATLSVMHGSIDLQAETPVA
jgi:hypothetical protein